MNNQQSNTPKEYTQVRAIANGTVIDHLPPSSMFKILHLLKLEQTTLPVIFGMNLDSKRMGKKALIKIVDKVCHDMELAYLALVAPSARISIIKDFKVVNKRQIEAPTVVKEFVKCANPSCITNHQNITTHFSVTNSEGELLLKCKYCEKITLQEQIEIIK